MYNDLQSFIKQKQLPQINSSMGLEHSNVGLLPLVTYGKLITTKVTKLECSGHWSELNTMICALGVQMSCLLSFLKYEDEDFTYQDSIKELMLFLYLREEEV